MPTAFASVLLGAVLGGAIGRVFGADDEERNEQLPIVEETPTGNVYFERPFAAMEEEPALASVRDVVTRFGFTDTAGYLAVWRRNIDNCCRIYKSCLQTKSATEKEDANFRICSELACLAYDRWVRSLGKTRPAVAQRVGEAWNGFLASSLSGWRRDMTRLSHPSSARE